MKCPKCNVDLRTQSDRGVEVEACPACQGMWLTPAELDQLENEAFSNEANKGSLYLVAHEIELKCPVCSAALKRFDYRFFDLQLDCCPEHGFWLDKDEDDQILELMRGEEERVERKFGTESSWAKYINHLRSPTFFSKVKDLFHRQRVDAFLQAAVDEARKGLAEGGIPIGSVLVLDGKIIGCGHNQRVQHGSVIHHAEMNCLENTGRLKASVYQRCVLYSTLSPCPMCSGAILLYKIPRVVIGENKTFQGPEEYVRSQGVKVEVLQDPACIQLMRDFIKAKPELWNEDIGI